MHPGGPEHLRSTASVGTLARRQCGCRRAGHQETQARMTQQPGNARLWEPRGATTIQLERKDGWVQANALEGRQQTREETETGRSQTRRVPGWPGCRHRRPALRVRGREARPAQCIPTYERGQHWLGGRALPSSQPPG